jgi:hypothetical protein
VDLDELRHNYEEDIKKNSQKHSSELAAHDSKRHGTLGAAKALLSEEELKKFRGVPSVEKIGETAGSAAEVGQRRQ